MKVKFKKVILKMDEFDDYSMKNIELKKKKMT